MLLGVAVLLVQSGLYDPFIFLRNVINNLKLVLSKHEGA